MIVKILKHKILPETYGQIIHRNLDSANILPCNIPDLFPETASIQSLKILNKDREGNFKERIDDYDMIDMTIEIKIID